MTQNKQPKKKAISDPKEECVKKFHVQKEHGGGGRPQQKETLRTFHWKRKHSKVQNQREQIML